MAFRITKKDFKPKLIPLTLGARKAHASLMVAYVLVLDPEGEYLSVSKSQFGLYLDEHPSEKPELLAHWDYERQPTHGYPAAHVQVNGEASHFDRLCDLARERLGRDCPPRPMGHLHLPVGGRRYRPSLEDVIEFLILENLVDCRAGWKEVIETHREIWEARQLQAAVRRLPQLAIDQLRADGHL